MLNANPKGRVEFPFTSATSREDTFAEKYSSLNVYTVQTGKSPRLASTPSFKATGKRYRKFPSTEKLSMPMALLIYSDFTNMDAPFAECPAGSASASAKATRAILNFGMHVEGTWRDGSGSHLLQHAGGLATDSGVKDLMALVPQLQMKKTTIVGLSVVPRAASKDYFWMRYFGQSTETLADQDDACWMQRYALMAPQLFKDGDLRHPRCVSCSSMGAPG